MDNGCNVGFFKIWNSHVFLFQHRISKKRELMRSSWSAERIKSVIKVLWLEEWKRCEVDLGSGTRGRFRGFKCKMSETKSWKISFGKCTWWRPGSNHPSPTACSCLFEKGSRISFVYAKLNSNVSAIISKLHNFELNNDCQNVNGEEPRRQKVGRSTLPCHPGIL